MQIRVAEVSDGESVAAIYAPIVRDSIISFESLVPDAEEMASRIETTLQRFPWLVAEEEGRVTGYAYAGAHRARAAYRWACDVSVYVDARARRCGLGRRLYGALFDCLVAQGLGQAYAGVALPNPASVRLHESLGFEPIGVYRGVGFKQGAWHDVGWWALQLQELGAAPAEPIPFAALQEGRAPAA